MELIFRDIDDIIELHNAGGLAIAQSIGHTFATTDFVLDSYGDSAHPVKDLINTNLVSLIAFTDSHIIEIQNIYSKHKNSLSITDCSVIFYAMSNKCVLISNQKVLINIGASYNIKTYTTMVYFQEIKLHKTG